MSYATVNDMLAWFGSNEMINATQRPGDAGNDPRQMNQVIVELALQGAQEEIESALGERYVLPVGVELIPQQLKECQLWLTWCRLIAHSPRVTEEMQRECKRWRTWLQDLKDHRASLGLAERISTAPVYVGQSVSQFAWERYE